VIFGSEESRSLPGICLFVPLTLPSSDAETQFPETERVGRTIHRAIQVGEIIESLRGKTTHEKRCKKIRILWKTFILKKLFFYSLYDHGYDVLCF
jgi:hypothetical protein